VRSFPTDQVPLHGAGKWVVTAKLIDCGTEVVRGHEPGGIT
jgi:hypothetical protein